jgi:hypothetical protein
MNVDLYYRYGSDSFQWRPVEHHQIPMMMMLFRHRHETHQFRNCRKINSSRWSLIVTTQKVGLHMIYLSLSHYGMKEERERE